MDVRVNFDEENNEYQLGAEVDGVFVPFVSRPSSDVQARVTAAQELERSATPTPAAGAPAATATAAPDARDARIAELEAQLEAANAAQPPAA